MVTWKHEWRRIGRKLPEDFVWKVQGVIRKNVKGRPRDGMVMGIKKKLIEKRIKIEEVIEGMMKGRVRCGKER